MLFTRDQISGIAGRWRATFVVLPVLTAACIPSAARQGTRPVADLLGARGALIAPLVMDSAPPPIPEGPLTSDGAVRLAVSRSPHVRAELSQVGISAADLWQASRFPNPTITVLGASASGGGTGLSSFGVGIPIVSALQRPLRTRVATAQLRAAERAVAGAVFGSIIQVQRAYIDVQFAQQSLELRQSVAATTAASAGAARAIRDAGNLPDMVVAGEEALAAQSASDVVLAEAAVARARAELGRLLGAAIGDTLWMIPDRMRDPETETWRIDALDSVALAQRLDVAAAREHVQAALAALGLANRFRLLPDGSIGGIVEQDPDGRFVGATGNIVLPIFDGGGAAVARARAMLRVRAAEHAALVVDAHADIRTAWANTDAARRRADILRTMVLPARRRLVQETLLQVNAMAMPVFALLSAKQAEIDAGIAYLESVRDFWLARADLERATGGILPPRSGR
jgi:outer membrane protein, heavy metal efflux system